MIFSNLLYFITLGAPLLPLLLFVSFQNKIKNLNKFFYIFLLIIVVDLSTNILNVVLDGSVGNITIVTNFSVFVQSILIVYLFKIINSINTKVLLTLVFSFIISFFLESLLKTKLLEPNTFSILFIHFLIVIFGWYVIYNSYRNTTDFQFQITSTIVLYNTIFLVKLFFQEKIKNSVELFDFVFIASCLFYIGVYFSFSLAIWLEQKNSD